MSDNDGLCAACLREPIEGCAVMLRCGLVGSKRVLNGRECTLLGSFGYLPANGDCPEREAQASVPLPGDTQGAAVQHDYTPF